MCFSGADDGPSCSFHSASSSPVPASAVPGATASTGTAPLPGSRRFHSGLLHLRPAFPCFSVLFRARRVLVVRPWGPLRGRLWSPHAAPHKRAQCSRCLVFLTLWLLRASVLQREAGNLGTFWRASDAGNVTTSWSFWYLGCRGAKKRVRWSRALLWLGAPRGAVTCCGPRPAARGRAAAA